jgi:hypothetical protein
MSADAEKGRELESDPGVAALLSILRDYGVLTREELLERSGARRWRDQTFKAVLRRGVAEGSIKDLGGGLFGIGDGAPDPNQGKFDPG